jgi:CBS domain-containing protein
MTISDYVQALQVCRRQGISMLDLSTRTITDMMQSPAMTFRHPEFQSMDAEDSIKQMCLHLHRLEADYVPVLDPDEGNLVGILGYLDVVHLLDQAAKQHPHLFSETIEAMRIGQFNDVLTAPRTALLHEVLTVLAERNIVAMPVIDETGKVIGLFHRADVTFVTRSPDPDSVLTNLSELLVGDAIALQQQQLQSGEALTTTPHVLVTCSLRDRLSVVLNAMMLVRSTIVVCVDDRGACLGVITIKDIVKYYFEGGRSSRK